MLPSHKTGVTYLEYCRIVVSDERLSFIKAEQSEEKYWSIPYATTGCILLGPGTSVTQKAAKFLASENVMFGFVGGGGSPLFLASQSEYRPTKYMQRWCSFWYQEPQRIKVAKYFMSKRADFIEKQYRKAHYYCEDISNTLNNFRETVVESDTTTKIFNKEALMARRLYQYWAAKHSQEFRRKSKGSDSSNRFLTNGNYLAYGLAASALWVLGISHAFPVLHGKTRRGGLVFDVADLIKDACIMPAAFIGANEGDTLSQNRQRCVASLDQSGALPFLMNTIREAIDVGCCD